MPSKKSEMAERTYYEKITLQTDRNKAWIRDGKGAEGGPQCMALQCFSKRSRYTILIDGLCNGSFLHGLLVCSIYILQKDGWKPVFYFRTRTHIDKSVARFEGMLLVRKEGTKMKEKGTASYEQVISILCPHIREILSRIPDQIKSQIQEIRLRSCQPILLIGLNGTCFVSEMGRVSYILSSAAVRISHEEVTECFHAICGYSVHSYQDSICSGYITLPGGHRAGICGTAVCENGKTKAVHDIASINLRIARQVIGAADALIGRLFRKEISSVLLAGGPGSGKTTLLRDLARQLSIGSGCESHRVAVVDEREEIAAVYEGVAQNDLGYNCDILSGYPKGEAILTALRSLSPEVIICDEVGNMEEIQAIEAGVNAGVTFIASIHAATREDLLRRPQARRLLETGAFDHVVLLAGGGLPGRISQIYRAEELIDEICGDVLHSDRLHLDGTVL